MPRTLLDQCCFAVLLALSLLVAGMCLMLLPVEVLLVAAVAAAWAEQTHLAVTGQQSPALNPQPANTIPAAQQARSSATRRAK